MNRIANMLLNDEIDVKTANAIIYAANVTLGATAMEKAPYGYAEKIKKKVEALLEQHYKDTFMHWLETERVVCQPAYKLPVCIHPTVSTNVIGGSLYQAEEEMSPFERSFAMGLTALPNIRWWHRNIARQEGMAWPNATPFPNLILYCLVTSARWGGDSCACSVRSLAQHVGCLVLGGIGYDGDEARVRAALLHTGGSGLPVRGDHVQ